MALCLRVELKEKRCAVFGGGAQALRRTKQLLQEGAQVVVYSPVFGAEFSQLSVQCILQEYRPDFLKDIFFAAAATDSPQVNEQIVQDCTKRGILVISSTKSTSPFHPMANRSWDGGIVAVSVPNSPTLAARLAQTFSDHAQTHYAQTAKLLGQLRKNLLHSAHPQATEILRRAANQSDQEIEHLLKGEKIQ